MKLYFIYFAVNSCLVFSDSSVLLPDFFYVQSLNLHNELHYFYTIKLLILNPDGDLLRLQRICQCNFFVVSVFRLLSHCKLFSISLHLISFFLLFLSLSLSPSFLLLLLPPTRPSFGPLAPDHFKSSSDCVLTWSDNPRSTSSAVSEIPLLD